MPRLFPERPRYRRERLLAGYLLLTAFLVLFLTRLFTGRLALLPDTTAVWALAAAAALLLPALIFPLLMGRGYARALRPRAIRAAHLPLLLTALVALFAGCFLLSFLCRGTATFGNSVAAYAEMPAGIGAAALRAVVLGILPALVEELLFRGVLCAEYERRGAVRAILMSTVFFAMLHFDLRNLPAYFLMGLLLSLVLFATNSLFAAMLLRVCFELAGFFGYRYFASLYALTGSVELYFFLLSLLALLALYLFARCAARLYQEKDEAGTGAPRRDVPWNVQFYTIADALLDPPVLLCIGLFVAGCILF